MSESIPEKFASYFSSINSLSSKIFSEVQLIDKAIVDFSDTKVMSYDERCAFVDKVLIHDPLHSKPEKLNNNSLSNFKPALFRDDCLDQPQTDSLIRFIYPKKPEKYVFDENGCWIDEHAEPFSYCKESQAKCCSLDILAKNLPAEMAKMSDLKCSISDENHISESKSQPQLQKRKEVKKKSRAPFCGVNVMGLGLNENDGPSSDIIQKRHQETDEDECGEAIEDEDSNLPRQKQNLDLIAELQAKLNKNKITRNNIRSTPPPPPPTQNQNVKIDDKKESSQCASSPSTVSKVCKPKAPPPPPPIQKPPVPPMEKQKAAVEKGMKVTEVRKASICATLEPSVVPDVKKEEFLVDVSSPCKIKTPKTGFDFLDNW